MEPAEAVCRPHPPANIARWTGPCGWPGTYHLPITADTGNAPPVSVGPRHPHASRRHPGASTQDSAPEGLFLAEARSARNRSPQEHPSGNVRWETEDEYLSFLTTGVGPFEMTINQSPPDGLSPRCTKKQLAHDHILYQFKFPSSSLPVRVNVMCPLDWAMGGPDVW